MIEILRGSTTG